MLTYILLHKFGGMSIIIAGEKKNIYGVHEHLPSNLTRRIVILWSTACLNNRASSSFEKFNPAMQNCNCNIRRIVVDWLLVGSK